MHVNYDHHRAESEVDQEENEGVQLEGCCKPHHNERLNHKDVKQGCSGRAQPLADQEGFELFKWIWLGGFKEGVENVSEIDLVSKEGLDVQIAVF